jgi:hypothetical protein
MLHFRTLSGTKDWSWLPKAVLQPRITGAGQYNSYLPFAEFFGSLMAFSLYKGLRQRLQEAEKRESQNSVTIMVIKANSK